MNINLTDLQDLRNRKDLRLISIVNEMTETINNGEEIVIEQRYSNAEPDIIAILHTPEQLADWLNVHGF